MPLLHMLVHVQTHYVYERKHQVQYKLASFAGLFQGGGERAWYTLFTNACDYVIITA